MPIVFLWNQLFMINTQMAIHSLTLKDCYSNASNSLSILKNLTSNWQQKEKQKITWQNKIWAGDKNKLKEKVKGEFFLPERNLGVEGATPPQDLGMESIKIDSSWVSTEKYLNVF